MLHVDMVKWVMFIFPETVTLAIVVVSHSFDTSSKQMQMKLLRRCKGTSSKDANYAFSSHRSAE
jgi:hypothetical protein